MLKHVPNTLTIIRFLLIPFIVACIFNGNFIAAFIIFTISGITDIADGFIARKFNLVSNFGKLMDPLADKLLVCSAMIALIDLDRIPAWVVIVIIAREFIISGFRLVASDNGIVIAAGWWGKIKTVCQMFMVILLICDFGGSTVHIIENVLIYLALALTIISLIDYLVKNKNVLSETK